MSSGEPTLKDEKMSAKVIFARGMDFFESGDFLAARADFKAVLEVEANPELKKKARDMLKKMKADPVEIIAGVLVFLLLVFLFVYFGLRS